MWGESIGRMSQEEGIMELLEAPGKLADTFDGMSGTCNLDDKPLGFASSDDCPT